MTKVFLDYDQKALDDAYDQAVYAPNRDQILKRLAYTSELERGRNLVARVHGRCDLILHGHRHTPRGARLFGSLRPIHIYNAGCSTELGRVRVFGHDGAGHLQGGPLWLDIPAPWADADHAFAAEGAPARLSGRADTGEAGFSPTSGLLDPQSAAG